MADIQTANQAQPSALENAPGSEPEFNFDSLLEQNFAPMNAGPVGPIEADSEFNFDALLDQSGIQPEIQEGSSLSVGERAKLSFAMTDKEKHGFLSKLPGVEKVEQDGDGEFILTRNGKRQKVDPDTFELLADTADFTRSIFEGSIEAGATAAGTTVAPGAGTVIGAGIGGAAATNLADLVATELIGIERDEERSRVTETLFAASVSTVFAGAGVALKKVAQSRKIAKEAAQRIADADALPIETKQLLESIQHVDDLGLTGSVKGADGKPIKFLLTQLESPNPRIREAAEKIRLHPEFQRVEQELGEQSVEVVNKIVKSIGKSQGFDDVINRASKDELISQKVTKMVKQLKLQEGKTIEKFKKFAAGEFKTTPAPVNQTDEVLSDVFKELGIKRQGDSLIGLDSETISNALIIDDTAAVKRFASDLGELTETLFNKGGLSPDDVEYFVGRLGKLNESPLMRKSGKLRYLNGRLTSALRKDRIDIVETALEGTPQAGQFRESMKKFSNIMGSVDQVNALLRGENMSSDAFVKSIFNKGKEGLADLRAAKALIKSEDPQLWKELSGEFTSQVIDEVTDFGTKKLSISNFSRKMLSFGKDFRKEIMEDSPFTEVNLRHAINIARKFEAKKFANLSRSEQESLVRQGIQVSSNFRDAQIRGFTAMVKRIFPSKEVRTFMTQEGIDNLLKDVQKSQRPLLRRKLENALIMLGDMRPITEGVIQGGASTGVRQGTLEE